MKEPRLELYDASGSQHEPSFRNLRFSKNIFGGEDMWLSFLLDRDIRINYPDVAYGNQAILRRGLTPVWKGEIREIDQEEQSIGVNCLGQWVHLDDYNYDGEGRLWCESRYGLWKTAIGIPGVTWLPERFGFDKRDRLHMTARRNEMFGNAPWVVGGFSYECDYDEIKRVSFDFDTDLLANWQVYLRSWDATWGAPNDEWIESTVGARTGIKDIVLTTARPRLAFFIVYNAANARFAGETGDVQFTITNLRLWGQQNESPSMIRVTGSIISAVEAATPISADQMLAQEQLFVRDFFADPNGTLLANHQPDIDKERGGWSIDAGGFDIQANQANNTGAGANRAVIDCGESDGILNHDFTTPGAGNFVQGLIFRRSAANNYWRWDIRQTGNLRLRKVVAGVPTDVYDVNVGIQAGYTYHLMVKLRGDLIEGYVGGILRASTNDSFNQAQTQHGILHDNQANLRSDNFEMYQAPPIWPLFYDDGESAYKAMEDCASFGDWNWKEVGWGVEPGGDRVFLRELDRSTIRYVIPAEYVIASSSRGKTRRDFYTEAWAKYRDEEGIWRWTDKYYVHVTNDGLVVNTTATGDDLASVVYGVTRDKSVNFGRVDENLAIEYLIRWLQQHGHPQVSANYAVTGPVQDLHRGGAWIDPTEMEMGYLVQIPFFRAVEAEGAALSDLRDWDTTFMLVGMEYDDERNQARLIPEGAIEDLKRIIAHARAFQAEDERRATSKRSEPIGG